MPICSSALLESPKVTESQHKGHKRKRADGKHLVLAICSLPFMTLSVRAHLSLSYCL